MRFLTPRALRGALISFGKENEMKLRSTLLLLVSMLLVGSLAGAATADPAPVPPAPAVAASPIVASPLCLANTSKAQLPAGNPVLEKSTQLCGSCSDIWCANNTLGALCQTGKRCYNLYGFTCSDGVTNKCTCYSGQLP
jgi:hypothetical protein